MNVFIVTQTFAPQTGGMEGVMTALAKNFAARGDDVIVLPDKPHSANGYQTVQKKRLKFRRAAAKRSWLKGRLTATDIVICDSWKSVAAVPPHHGKLVVLAHGQEYLKSGRRARRVQKALDRVTHLVASSQYTLNLVEKGWETQHIKATVIPPTYMLADDIPHRPKKPKTPIRLVSICRLEARKGLMQSLLALSQLGEAIPEWRWDIGGSGPQQDELAATIASLNLENRVFLLGRIDEADKNDLLATADLFIMPSYQEGKSLEGFGISYAEAARFGVPSIAGQAGGAPEAVIDDKTGWCIDANTPEALCTTLAAALSNDALRRGRGIAAQHRYAARLTGEAASSAFLNHIR